MIFIISCCIIHNMRIAKTPLLLLLFVLFYTHQLYAQRVIYSGLTLAGGEDGLFGFDDKGKAVSFKGAGNIKTIINTGGIWAVLGSEGIFVSSDLQNWENRSQGLPKKTIKLFQNGTKSFLPVMQDIKDFEIDPENPDIMACATKDCVYFSRNQGRSWVNLGAPPYRTNGIKAVAAAQLKAANGVKTTTIFLSHSVYGIYYIQPDMARSSWTEISKGLEQLETSDNADEVSDIKVRVTGTDSGVTNVEIYASQTFRRRIYRLDWDKKTFNMVWFDRSKEFGTVDSIYTLKNKLYFLMEETAAELDISTQLTPTTVAEAATLTSAQITQRPDLRDTILSMSNSLGKKPNCVVMRDKKNDNSLVFLNELWLVTGGASVKPQVTPEGIYLPVNFAMEEPRLKRILELMSERKLNMIVIDMKDDYGRLRFTPKNPAITEKGRVFRPVDIDAMLANFKKRGIYSVARIVVFKDPVLAAKENYRYAVWDSRNNKQWLGYHDKKQNAGTGAPEDSAYETVILPSSESGKEILRTFYDEKWVDPFSEVVWDYNAAVAAELHERGFDEIQFDYIRFPTDGVNLNDAQYRWQDKGMDMESAILSFLRHIRANVKAPISIDIYGANGWYRTGARTGQEVELLAPWVDVICPMYYPSHFEQGFLAQPPAVLRPWRIYYMGTLRTARIGRGQIIVRPYVQAFRLGVSYDRKYYNEEYVINEIKGVRDAGSGGFTYWNNSGRYDDIPIP